MTVHNHRTPVASYLENPAIALILTLIIVIIVRESCVLACRYIGIESASNVVGLVVMFAILLVWRFFREKSQKVALPFWLTHSSNKLLVDSGFAFLPISAGAGLILFSMQDEFWGVLATMVISTLVPLWALAKLANFWLGNHRKVKKDSRSNSL